MHVASASLLWSAVQDALSLYLFDTAVWLAERLFAAQPTADSLYLVAHAYITAGDPGHASRLLRKYDPFTPQVLEQLGVSPMAEPSRHRLQYTYGSCMLQVHRYQEADVVLRNLARAQRETGVGAQQLSATMLKLGIVEMRLGRTDESVRSLASSAESWMMNWGAIEQLGTCAPAKLRRMQSLYHPGNFRVQVGGEVRSAKKHRPCDPGHDARLDDSPIVRRVLHMPPADADDPPPRPHLKRVHEPEEPVGPDGEQAAAELGSLLGGAATVVACAAENSAAEALAALSKLPAEQQASGYFLSAAARVRYSAAQFEAACTAFETLRRREPHRLDPAYAQYSSCLWQLRRDKVLGALSQQLISMDRCSATTQVVLGNAHSVVGEHELALKFLKRAVLIDRSSAYAVTLCGQEHMLLDETETAMEHFRSAIQLDSRDYVAWHGLGQAYLKLERFQHAVHHIRKARALNPNAPVLLSLSQAMEALSEDSLYGALSVVEEYLARDPQHQAMRLRRAELLVRRKEYSKAQRILEQLMDELPREVNVLLMLAKVHKRLNNAAAALKFYDAALTLNPKLNASVKVEMERLQGSDSEEEARQR